MQNVRDSNPTGTAYTDKKENQILLIYEEIQNEAVAKSYMGKYFRISSYIRKLFLICDLATAPL
jgi:hypothetical protein